MPTYTLEVNFIVLYYYCVIKDICMFYSPAIVRCKKNYIWRYNGIKISYLNFSELPIFALEMRNDPKSDVDSYMIRVLKKPL